LSGRRARSRQPENEHLTENAAALGRWRLFVAAPVPELAAARVFEVLADVRARHPMVKWVPINKLHLTLVFLGQTDPARVSEIAGVVARVAAQHAPFDVATGDAGGKLDDRRGGVAWLRLADGGHQIAQLSIALDNAIGSHTFDDLHAPRPHLTVARRVSEAALKDLQSVASQVTFGWTVNRVVLLRSHTDPTGSIYEPLASVDLTHDVLI
jgi:RNA 2',3'-cyclic 3'-phosphodiesterase